MSSNEQTNYYVKILKIWIQVSFYSILLCLLCKICGVVDIGFGSIVNSVFPISTKMYWYATAYIALLAFAPFLNSFINNISKKQYAALVLMIVLLASFWDDITPYTEPLSVGGYSFLWLAQLYLISGYIRRFVDVNRLKKTEFFYVLSVIFLVISRYIGEHIQNIQFLSECINEDYFFRYNSLPVLVSSVLLFLSFLKMKKFGKRVGWICGFLSPLTFGVYLIHDNQFVRTVLWDNVIDFRNTRFDFETLFLILLIPIIIFVICAIVDFVRCRLFIKIYSMELWKKIEMSSLNLGKLAGLSDKSVGTKKKTP